MRRPGHRPHVNEMTHNLEQKSFQRLLDTLGIDNNAGDVIGTDRSMMVLMNMVLQCLGGVRNIAMKKRKRLEAEKSMNHDSKSFVHDENKLNAITTTFATAVKRHLYYILTVNENHDLDPANHLIESFPNSDTIGTETWLPLHWAMLGDIDIETLTKTAIYNSGTMDLATPNNILESPKDNDILNKDHDAAPKQTDTNQTNSSNIKPSEQLDLKHMDKSSSPDASSRKLAILTYQNTSNKSDKQLSYRDKSKSIHEEDDRCIRAKIIASCYPSSITDLDSEGRSYLHYACRLNSVPLLRTALSIAKSPISMNFTNGNGAIPFHNSARFSSSTEIVQFILNEFPEKISVGNKDGSLPLHWAAAKSKNYLIIDQLIAAMPEGIQKQNHEGYLPLHCSGQNSSVEVVRRVLEAFPGGIHITDHEGGYPLHHACCFNSSVEVVKCMYEAYPGAMNIPQHSGNLSPIHLFAAQNDSPEILRYILKVSPLSAKCQDHDGWLPLHCLVNRDRYSMTSNRVECIRMLLKHYPEAVHVKSTLNLTPIDLCRSSNQPVGRLIMRLLLNSDPSKLKNGDNDDKIMSEDSSQSNRISDKEMYFNLNWEARRTAILLITRLRSSVCQEFVFNKSSQRNEEEISQHQRAIQKFASVFAMICSRFENADSDIVSSKLARTIVWFL